ncbi:MAG TPA: type II secretion system secretin GspD [Syntrophales bacterium]|nr:type II secretion system secretin GspD [Syntrophales bacterium]HPQ43901.1 type II secretion system secretin GspD [Syntrophales bacterium]
MKRSIITYISVSVIILCLVSFTAPGIIMGAKVTGEEKLVTTSGTKTTPAEKPSIKAPPNGEVAKKETLAKPQEQDDSSKFVTIDFDNVDIRVFIKFISELTGTNFVIDREVKGTVTIISPKKISIPEAYKVFESVLDVHGYSTVSSDNIIKIVPSRDAATRNMETRLKDGAITPEDRIVTQIISLNYANPDEMKKVLAPLISKSSVMLSYPPTGMLVVTDLLSNIKRLITIIEALDAEGIEEQISVIPLERASSTEIAQSLTQIFEQETRQKKGTPTSTIKIVADKRTNTIITLASDNDTSRIRQLLELLDKDVPKGEEGLHVYRLENADAEELAAVLMNLPSQQQDTKTTQKGKSPLLSKDIHIIPDKATNTLIITAERDDYAILEGVIKKLDIPRPMVYIEALIMEVNVDKGFNLGVEWMAGEEFGSNKYYGGGFRGKDIMPTVNATTGITTFPEGLSLGVFSETINIGGIAFPNLGAILQAYQKDEDVHILSTPQILTLDNEEAEIYVGENVPYQTRAETSSSDIDYSSYEYKDVGVTLRITPQISQGRFVRLNIYQEVTKLVTEAGQQTVRPTTLKRTAKTVVTIQDKNSIVIGGLIGDDVTNTAYKVPCLGNIPFLGWLFKYESVSHETRNLFIFITPHIVENPREASEIYEEKQEQIKKVEEGVIKTYEKKRKP